MTRRLLAAALGAWALAGSPLVELQARGQDRGGQPAGGRYGPGRSGPLDTPVSLLPRDGE